MSRRTFLPLLLALAVLTPASAQTSRLQRAGYQVYTGGPSVARHRLRKAAGTTGGGVSINPPVGIRCYYDLGDELETTRGGYDYVPADDDYYSLSGSDLPCFSGGSPDYPFSIVVVLVADTPSGSGGPVVDFSDGTVNERIALYLSGGSGNFGAGATSGGASGNAEAAAATAGRWHIAVAVFTSASSRAIYADVVPAGGSSSVTKNVTGISEMRVGRRVDGGTEHDGRIAYLAILPVGFSSSQRTAIFNGEDPVLVSGLPPSLIRASDGAQGEVWAFDNDGGVGRRGYDLTSNGTPAAQSHLIVVRDQVGGYPVKATTSAPTYSTSVGNGQGGGVFSAVSNQFLIYSGTLPLTDAPWQVYAAAGTTSTTTLGNIFWLGNTGSATDYYDLHFEGITAGDPVGNLAASSGGGNGAVTSTGYSASTNYLTWSVWASSTSRTVEINGGSSGSNTNSRAPSGSNALALGMRRDSSPDSPLSGWEYLVLVMDNASTTEQAPIERLFAIPYALGF